MNSRHFFSISFAVVLAGTFAANRSYCQNSAANSPQTNAAGAATPGENAPTAPAGSALVVPAATTIPLRLMNTVNSRTAQPGQALYCETIFPITAGNRIVIPRGSSVKGSITQVVRPKRGKHKQAQLGLRFETLILPNGNTFPLRATLSGFGTAGNEGFQPKEGQIEGASTKGEDVGKVAETTVTGAELGTIVGAADGSVWKGLGIGSLVGAGSGLVWILASRGKEIVLPSGTDFDLRLSAPLTLNRDDPDAPSEYHQGQAPPQ
jgi:Bacterial conjugation TrbI-like protein